MARIPTLDDDDARHARRLRLGRAGLDSLMRDERYWDGGHPDHEALVNLVRQGFELVFNAAPARPGGRERPPFATPPIAPPLPGTRQAPRDAIAEYIAELESDAEGIDALSAKEQEALGRSAVLRAIRGSGHRLPSGFEGNRPKGGFPLRHTIAGGDENATRRHAIWKNDSPPVTIQQLDSQAAQADGSSRQSKDAMTGHSTSDSFLSGAFRDAIHRRESQKGDYQAFNPTGDAWGRYQLTPPARKQIGLENEKGQLTGKYGVESRQAFLNSPEAQEKAFAEYMRDNEKQLQRNGAWKRLGQRVEGIKTTITVTESGLLAAAHRQGARSVKDYLDFQEASDWKSDFSALDHEYRQRFLSVETRLREFQNIPYRKR